MASDHLNETFEHQIYDEGTQIPFKHIEHLGRGASSVVDKVQRTSGMFKGQLYARKLLFLEMNQQASIRNEVDIVKSISHAHVVRLIGTYQYQGKYAIIMIPVAAENLQEYLRRTDNGSLDNEGRELRERIPPWFNCLLSVVAYLHTQNIRHRDIKPSNILIRNGDVLLADFGIAMEFQGDTNQTVTTTGGTPKYRAPEVAEKRRSGRPADVFSLGAVFLEMLSAYSGPGQLKVFSEMRISESGSESYASNASTVLQWINFLRNDRCHSIWYSAMLFLCQKMLEKERDQRPTADDLRLCLSYQSFPAMPPAACKSCKLADPSDCYSPKGLNDALRKASGYGHKLAVYLLIERGAMISGSGALGMASEKGQKSVVQMLLERGADIEERDMQGRTALHLAAEHRRDEVVQLLLEHGADIKAKDGDQQTALHWAASKGNRTTIQLLLLNGANMATHDKNGWTAVQVATNHGHEAVVQLLTEAKADFEAKGNMAARLVRVFKRKEDTKQISYQESGTPSVLPPPQGEPRPRPSPDPLPTPPSQEGLISSPRPEPLLTPPSSREDPPSPVFPYGTPNIYLASISPEQRSSHRFLSQEERRDFYSIALGRDKAKNFQGNIPHSAAHTDGLVPE
jgi:serine/threonine protein kinase